MSDEIVSFPLKEKQIKKTVEANEYMERKCVRK